MSCGGGMALYLTFSRSPGGKAFLADPSSTWVCALYHGEGNGTPLQYSCLENPMDGGAGSAAVHGVAKSWTRLSDFTFTFHFPALEKEMATHSSVLAWRIPGTGEPGGLPSMGLHRVGHNWSDLAAAAALYQLELFNDGEGCVEKPQAPDPERNWVNLSLCVSMLADQLCAHGL